MRRLARVSQVRVARMTTSFRVPVLFRYTYVKFGVTHTAQTVLNTTPWVNWRLLERAHDALVGIEKPDGDSLVITGWDRLERSL